MDEELRKAQRLFQRLAGGDETGLLALYYEQIKDYLRHQKLPLLYGGVIRHTYQLRELYPEMVACQNMASRSIQFLHYADLDTRPSEEILQICCSHASWSEWFFVTAYYQEFVAKRPGSGVWSTALSARSEEPDKRWSVIGAAGTTYNQRLQSVFDSWSKFAIVCSLDPKYIGSRPPEKYYNWSAQIVLVGYEKN